MKKLIFDLDNTILFWKKEYDDGLIKYLENLGYQEEALIISNTLIDYENHFNTFSKKQMVEYVNSKIKKKISLKTLNNILNYYANCYDIDNKEEVVKTLEYLKDKYQMVVLTNWFTKYQKNRLDKANVSKFFSKVIGADKTLVKPNKDSFLKAKGLTNVTNCIVIGDNYDKDIVGALNVGMNAIYLNYKRLKTNYKNTIFKFEDLKEIL